MEPLTYIDFIFIGIISLSAIVGFITGLLKELMTLIAGLGALGVAFLTYHLFGDAFAAQLVSTNSRFDFALLIYLAIAIATYVILIMLLSMLTNNLTDLRSISTIDKFLGLGFGTVRGIAVGILFVFFLDVFIAQDRVPKFVTESAAYPHLQKASGFLLAAYAPKSENGLDNATEND